MRVGSWLHLDVTTAHLVQAESTAQATVFRYLLTQEAI
ncbi:hypothetical protein KYG_01707 [Acidovorax sp. NO-1]|nr:hypothetical protein KYG_01707 [Acidovorax sp. NO-1]